MKFKKLLSLSSTITIGMIATSLFFLKKCGTTDKPIRFTPLPELRCTTDTVFMTNENFDETYANTAAGLFLPYQNTVHITYYQYDSTANKRVKYNCDRSNQDIRVITRHEMEHATKAHMVKNSNNLSNWTRARLEIMNESMAPGAEIIEAIEYHQETGQRYPTKRIFLQEADCLIMCRHQQMTGEKSTSTPVNFDDPVIADIILDKAVDKFAKEHARGFYHTRIKNALKGEKTKEYKPHNQCDLFFPYINYAPEFNQWGALWTYKVKVSQPLFGTRKVDIWNSATSAARTRAINKVDSIIKTDLRPGQILQLSKRTK